MELMPVRIWNAGMHTAVTSCGRLRRSRMFRNGCSMVLASSLASTMSVNSASTSAVPRMRSSTRRPSSTCPRSIRLLGVSGRHSPPTVINSAGAAARPSDSRHPHGLIFCVP
uniref:GSVIVT00005628001, HT7 n=1 Tax=Arundo donax TaxID=35708 RepID=A0A0A9GN13_ARUDO